MWGMYNMWNLSMWRIYPYGEMYNMWNVQHEEYIHAEKCTTRGMYPHGRQIAAPTSIINRYQ